MSHKFRCDICGGVFFCDLSSNAILEEQHNFDFEKLKEHCFNQESPGTLHEGQRIEVNVSEREKEKKPSEETREPGIWENNR